MIRRVPVGVVGAITPWNSPSVLGMRVVAPALALGNAVVLKPDPQTPVCGGAMFAAIFKEAGLPDGLLQIVIGDAEAGQALVTDPNINMVSFTGSTEVGRIVGAQAGGLLKKVSLELGGNNPLIVLDDADLPAAASAGAYSSFQFQGQVCFATGPPHRPSLGRRRVRRPARPEGAPAAHGRPVPRGRRARTDRQREADPARRRHRPALAQTGGARLVEGGTYEGLFYRPTVLADVKLDSPAWTDEIFGPVAPVVTFSIGRRGGRAGQAQRVRPRRRRLLALDLARPLDRQPNPGRAWSTSTTRAINDEATIPFGGMGISGNGGRFGGEANLEAFTQWQWVTVRDEPRSFGPTY